MYILSHRDYCDFVGGLVATADVWTTGESWSKTMTFINIWIIFLISQKLTITLEALSILMYPGLWRTDPCMGWPQNNLSIRGYPPSAYICGFAVKWFSYLTRPYPHSQPHIKYQNYKPFLTDLDYTHCHVILY